jgi:hypothetical protein
MAIEVPPVAAPPPAAPPSTTASEPESFDQRWAAWQAKGAAHDRAVRRKMAVAAPIMIILTAVITYVLLGR